MAQPSTRPPLYKGYRFPPEIISHCVWLYFRFGVSLRDVSELMLARGIEVSHEAIRLWTLRFCSVFSTVCNQFRPGRHALSAPNYRTVMRRRWQEWDGVSETIAFAVAA